MFRSGRVYLKVGRSFIRFVFLPLTIWAVYCGLCHCCNIGNFATKVQFIWLASARLRSCLLFDIRMMKYTHTHTHIIWYAIQTDPDCLLKDCILSVHGHSVNNPIISYYKQCYIFGRWHQRSYFNEYLIGIISTHCLYNRAVMRFCAIQSTLFRIIINTWQ